jgi:hypothetical protein
MLAEAEAARLMAIMKLGSIPVQVALVVAVMQVLLVLKVVLTALQTRVAVVVVGMTSLVAHLLVAMEALES